MLSHTEQLELFEWTGHSPASHLPPPPRQPNPVEPIAGCRGQEGPLGGGGWGEGVRGGACSYTLDSYRWQSLRRARGNKELHLYTSGALVNVVWRIRWIVLLLRALFQLVCTWGRRREMKLHNERLRTFLEQCSFFLVTGTSRSYLVLV